LVDAVHQKGCPVFIQFQHAGPWNHAAQTGHWPSSTQREELPGSFDVLGA
jgi:2,4-dienoyl-CoA reductase-like NADH-dependent reductase (Old Yellow Enzyme family)